MLKIKVAFFRLSRHFKGAPSTRIHYLYGNHPIF